MRSTDLHFTYLLHMSASGRVKATPCGMMHVRSWFWWLCTVRWLYIEARRLGNCGSRSITIWQCTQDTLRSWASDCFTSALNHRKCWQNSDSCDTGAMRIKRAHLVKVIATCQIPHGLFELKHTQRFAVVYVIVPAHCKLHRRTTQCSPSLYTQALSYI